MDFTDLYSTRIEKSFDDDQIDILARFKEEFAKKSPMEVELINYYKGLPVCYRAKIVGIDRDTLDLDIHPQQALAIEKNRHVFIRAKVFKHDLVANVQYVNVRKHAASLRKLCYVEILAERRKFLRLIVEPSPKAILLTGETATGKLIEISLSGACVLLEQPCSLEPGEDTTLLFMLPNLHQNTSYNIKVPATLVAISGDALPRHYRFSITPDKMLDRMISQYIFQRQVEIIKEMKDAVD